MTVSVTAKSRTITNGTANDGTSPEASFVELYNNDIALASYIDSYAALNNVANTFTLAQTLSAGAILAGTPSTNGQIGYASNQFKGYRNGTLANFLMAGDALTSSSNLDDLNDVTITSATSGQYLKYNGTVWVNTAGPAFTQTFTSTDQTITTAGTLTLAHGLGIVPTITQGFLVCQTAEYGYSIGDIVAVGFHDYGSGNGIGFTPDLDATNIFVQYGNSTSVFYVAKRTATAGISVALTNANWKLRVRAWA